MTLIATFQVENTPVMIGDILLSTTGIDRPHAPIPTIEDASQILPTEWLRIIAGTKRKISIVHPKVAVGWTGTLIYSEYFIKQVKEQLNNCQRMDCDIMGMLLSRCKELLEKHAEKNDFIEDDITVIGWFITSQDEIFQFEWNPINTHFYERANILARGTGEDHFVNLLNRRELAGKGSREKNIENVALDAVATVSSFLANEVTTGNNLNWLYGGGYDIVLFVNNRFQYLNDIMYVPVYIPYDGNSLTFLNPNLYFKYYYHKEQLVIARVLLELDKSGKVVNHVIKQYPLRTIDTDDAPLSEDELKNELKIESSIVSLIFVTNNSTEGILGIPFATLSSSKYIQFENGYIGINPEVFEIILPAINNRLCTGTDKKIEFKSRYPLDIS